MKLPDFFLSSQIKRLIGLLLLNHNNCENDTLLIFNFTCMTALATILILYLQEIVRLHRVPIDIVLNRNPKFISRFFKAPIKPLVPSSILALPTIFSQMIRVGGTIQFLEVILRTCILEEKGSWDMYYLPLIEFSYNNSSHFSII